MFLWVDWCDLRLTWVISICKPFCHGDLELLGIIANEVQGGSVAVKKTMSVLNIWWAVDSEVMASPGPSDSGLAHPGEYLEDGVEIIMEHISVCPHTE